MSFFHRLFKFRIFKFRTTLAEELEDLHNELIHLQLTLSEARLQQQKWTKLYAIYAIIGYLILNIVYFTLFLSSDSLIRFYAIMISLTIGALLYGLFGLLCWYFRTTIRMKEDRLALYKDRKQELIEEVKTKETYAVAKDLLQKYGETIQSEVRKVTTNDNVNRDLRQRVSVKPTLPGSEKPTVTVVPTNIGTLETFRPSTPGQGTPVRSMVGTAPGKLPREILPPQRTFWGAILDIVVGDGPSKRLICDEHLHERWKFRFRYALICKSCNSHNGMALEEEFEYISFRCAYCNYYNKARKEKPVFRGDIVSHDVQPKHESNVEKLKESSELLTSEDKRSDEIHPSINISTTDHDEQSQYDSATTENRREYQPELSSTSSEESLSKKD